MSITPQIIPQIIGFLSDNQILPLPNFPLIPCNSTNEKTIIAVNNFISGNAVDGTYIVSSVNNASVFVVQIIFVNDNLSKY